MENSKEKPILLYTRQEFIDLLRETFPMGLSSSEVEKMVNKPPHYIYGIKGLSNLLGCSLSTAERIKLSGIIDPAISQCGHLIIINSEMALDLLNKNKRK